MNFGVVGQNHFSALSSMVMIVIAGDGNDVYNLIIRQLRLLTRPDNRTVKRFIKVLITAIKGMSHFYGFHKFDRLFCSHVSLSGDYLLEVK